jgi:phosphonate transport system substrate-binding protein
MSKVVAISFLLMGMVNIVVGSELQTRAYTVGIVPQFEVRKLNSIWRPILDRLEKETGMQFELRHSVSIPDFEDEFKEGKFDFAYMNPYHMLIANKYAGYVPLIRDHGRSLSGVLVVRKDSGITNPEQLNGKKLAFPAPNALGASLQMRQELEDKFGIKFESSFVKTHDSVYLNVLLGTTIAGGGVQKTFNSQKKQHKEMLSIIHKTQAVPSHPVAARTDVPIEIRVLVRNALIRIGQLDAGQELLSKVPIKKIGVAGMEDYAPLDDMGLERFYISSGK